jgi:uncharacterized protein YjiS (DUF1127 family)
MTMSYINCNALNAPSSTTAKPGVLSRLINLPGTLVTAIIELRHNYKRRKLFVALLEYNDKMLEDMGLTRYLVEEASKLPLSANAAKIARKWARQE